MIRLKDNKQELEFIKEHGSNNQLFLTLRKQITIIQKTDKKIHDMSSAINADESQSSNLLSEVTAMSVKMYCMPGFNLT
jgi:hypothetical protein